MMETISVDTHMSRHLGIAEAKAKLSSLVGDVERSGTSYVIERYGHPAALIVQMPRQSGGVNHARGILSSYADPSKRTLENAAFARAMEAKHGDFA